MCFNGGGIGKALVPFNSKIDPIGNATNKALGLDEKKRQQVAATAAAKPVGQSVLATAATPAPDNNVLSTGKSA